MANALQFALSNPTPGMEAEFNDWYGGSHLQHGVETPGILSGQRFRRTVGPWPSGRHDYLMIWEIDDPAYALAELLKVKGSADMPISPAIDMATVQPPTMWRRAEVRSDARIVADSASRGTVVLGLYNAAAGEDAPFANALLHSGLADLAAREGVLSAQYLTLADEQIRGNARKFPHGLLIELHDAHAAVPALATALATLPHADPDRWQATVFAPIGVRVTSQERA